MTGNEIARDGAFIRVPMVVMDAASIQNWKDGNHLAIVGRGRAGSECRIGDHQGAPDAGSKQASLNQGDRHMALKTIIVDGLPVKITDAGEAAINLLPGKLADAATLMQTANTAHAKAIADKDAELAKKDGEIEELKKKVLDGTALDAMVADRAGSTPWTSCVAGPPQKMAASATPTTL